MLEGSWLSPSPQHQVHPLLKHGPRVRRVHREAVVFRTPAHNQTRDQSPAADHVDHREFFSDAGNRVIKRQRVTNDRDPHTFRLSGQDRSHQIRAGHRAIGILVMLIDAHPVKPQLVGQHQLIQIAVVKLVTMLRVIQRVRQPGPGRLVFVAKISRQPIPGHQVKSKTTHD